MTELTDEAVKALAHKYRFAKDDNERTIARTAEALLVARAELDRVKVAALAEVKALVVERAVKQLAAARETFCYASPGSDEDFTSLLLGFDTAAGIIRAITTDPELKTQIAHQTQKLSPM